MPRVGERLWPLSSEPRAAGCRARLAGLSEADDSLVVGQHLWVTTNDMFRGSSLAATGIYSLSSYHLRLGHEFALEGLSRSFYTIDSGWHDADSLYDGRLSWTCPTQPLTIEGGLAYFSRLRWMGPTTWEGTGAVRYGRQVQVVVQGSYDFNQAVGFYLSTGVRHRVNLSRKAQIHSRGDLGLDFGRAATSSTMRR